MTVAQSTGPLEYKVVQSLRDMGPSTPASVMTWITARDTAPHHFGAVFTTLKRLVGKGFLSVERRSGTTSRGGRRDMDVYTVTPVGVQAALGFQRSVQNFMLPDRGE